MSDAGKLWLIPAPLGGPASETIAAPVLEQVHRLSYFIAEEPKTARAFLKAIQHPTPLSMLRIERLDHNTADEDVGPLLDPVLGGTDAGILSEAGCPAVADPGSRLVALAHERGVMVRPLAGPSSIVLALMASGLEGQRFAFRGYLPVKEPDRTRAIQSLEARSRRDAETQVFIEAPYRNDGLLKALLSGCHANTWLCTATDLTLPTESVRTRRVGEWRTAVPTLDRRPTVFLLLAR
jgi:16S rRNA (cytidine1402-2'-O)-methyltransferase